MLGTVAAVCDHRCPSAAVWDPVTGTQRALPQFVTKDGRTSIPLQFEPYGGLFVVFRTNFECGGSPPLSAHATANESTIGTQLNFATFQSIQELTGP
ncbi:MAG: hypothetical protein WCJ66_06255 [Verrucomicrobiota bacterium]